jgi:LysM repeat protein
MLHLCDDGCKPFVIIVVNERRSTMADTLCTGSDRPSAPRRGALRHSLALRVAALTTLVASGTALATTAQAAPAAPASKSPSCAKTYQVRAGDGWTVIAARVGVRPRELYAVNGATHRTPITPGQTLCVPAAASVPTTTAVAAPSGTGSGGASCASKYTVQAGDGWTVIAKRAKVKVSALYTANNANASTPLYAGRSVCLPQGATVPSAPTTAPTPAPTTAPATTAPQRTYTRAEVEAIIRAVWPDDQEEKALAIAWRESNHKPGVRNWCCYGLFQLHWSAHKSWLATIGVTSSSQLFDPLVNANAALALYNRSGGWGPWGG